MEPCTPAISTLCQDQSVVEKCAPAINTIGISQYMHDQPTSSDHSSMAKQAQRAHMSSPSGMRTHIEPNSLLGPTSKPNLSTSPTLNTDPSTHQCLVHTHNFISTPQQHTLTSTPSPSNIKTPENQGELFDSQTLSKPRAPHVETKDELLSDFLLKKSGKKGKGYSSPKTWKRTDSIVNKKSGDSSDEVCYSSKQSHMDVDCYELPSKRRQFFMTGRKRVEWWRLVPSPAIINECPMLELSGAWEPSDRTGAWGFNPDTRSLSCVLNRNMVE